MQMNVSWPATKECNGPAVWEKSVWNADAVRVKRRREGEVDLYILPGSCGGRLVSLRSLATALEPALDNLDAVIAHEGSG